MMKDKLGDGKELDLDPHKSRWLKMHVANLMIIQFNLKLDKFYCIGVMY